MHQRSSRDLTPYLLPSFPTRYSSSSKAPRVQSMVG
jgi:hypothetical protein